MSKLWWITYVLWIGVYGVVSWWIASDMFYHAKTYENTIVQEVEIDGQVVEVAEEEYTDRVIEEKSVSPTPTLSFSTQTVEWVWEEDKELTLCQKQGDMSESECETLLAFYEQMNGDVWKNNDWRKKTESVCSWYGVWCQWWSVVTLQLANNNIVWWLSPEIGKLSSLISLDLSGNNKLTWPLKVVEELEFLKRVNVVDASLCWRLGDGMIEKLESNKAFNLYARWNNLLLDKLSEQVAYTIGEQKNPRICAR